MQNGIIIHSSLKKRKKILNSISKQNPTWKRRKGVVLLLFTLSICLIVVDIILLIIHPTDLTGVFVFLCAGVVMASVPFFIAISLNNKTKYECAFPYSSYANGTLILKQNHFEYIFWMVGPREPAAYNSPRACFCDEDRFSYSIEKGNIKVLKYDECGICRIVGQGYLSVPKWANLTVSQKEELENGFSFIMDFDEVNIKKIIENWRKNNG